MITLRYTVLIDAPTILTHDIMLGLTDKSSYEAWTAEFNPSSTYEGSWDEGSKIYFVGYDKEGVKGGMIAKIIKNDPGKYVSIQHNGLLKGDEEIMEGPEVDSWAGILENYSLEDKDGKTSLTVEIDTQSDYQGYFDESWPRAMNKLKEIVESK